MKEILIVGAGFSGAVVARCLAEAGYSITLIDKREHIGGNAFDYIDKFGIRIHKYGPHIFHTNNEKVYNWLSKFTDWIPYKHKVKAMLKDGDLVTLPVNKETIEKVGRENVVNVFIKPYSEKMWNIKLEDLDPQVTQRVPIRDDNNEFYFPNDEFQSLPRLGYSELIFNILNHKNIKVSLNTKFSKSMESKYYHVFNSMPIDEYFNFQFGELPYRSIKFHNVSLPMPKLFNVSVVNFTHNGPFTRITEWKNFPGHGYNECMTSLTYEEPCNYIDNNMERYYPVKDKDGRNKLLFEKYKSIPKNNMTFIGRLGNYLYLDMDQVVSNSLHIAKNFIQKNNE